MSRRLIPGRCVEVIGSYWVGSTGTVLTVDRERGAVVVELDHLGVAETVAPADLRVTA